MKDYDVCGMCINYPLYSRGSALDAMYDVYENGVMYGLEFTWVEEKGGCFSLPSGSVGTDIGRERLHLNADAGFYALCALTGFSDRARTRRTAVIWNPQWDEWMLTFFICGGPPLNGAELKISSAIREWIPSPGRDK